MDQEPSSYQSQVISILTQFYLDKDCMKVYHGRWDTWLISKNYMNEYIYLMMKTDLQLSDILKKAYEQANNISTSPLAKAMSEGKCND